jgi:hypothetical protein
MITNDLAPEVGTRSFTIMDMTPCAGTDVAAGTLVTATGLLVRPGRPEPDLARG